MSLREGRPAICLCARSTGYFYSRPYARGDCVQVRKGSRGKQISTHAPTREATNGGSGGSPHVGISTHAPTREATQLCGFYVIIQIISTHAPTREATRARSRARAGGAISTHAPTREATRQSPTLSRRTSNFYSRPYARGDSNFSQNHKLIYMINC